MRRFIVNCIKKLNEANQLLLSVTLVHIYKTQFFLLFQFNREMGLLFYPNTVQKLVSLLSETRHKSSINTFGLSDQTLLQDMASMGSASLIRGRMVCRKTKNYRKLATAGLRIPKCEDLA